MQTSPSWLAAFRVCAWPTISLGATDVAAIERDARLVHPDWALVNTCQRLEAYGLGDCSCDAPIRAIGEDALVRLASIAAGIESVILGEAQIFGQVRRAFADTQGPLRTAGDLALAAARETTRRHLPGTSNAGHLLDRALRIARLAGSGRLLVLGTGTMGRLVATRGRDLGFTVTVAGRTRPAWADAFVELGRVGELGRFHVIAGCLGSGAGLIHPRALPAASLLLDLGTPRNFVAVPEVHLITLEDLLADDANRPHAVALRRRLRGIVQAAVRRRLASLAEDSGHPLGRFRLAAWRLAQATMAPVTEGLSPAERACVERAIRSHLNRLLHPLTAALRAERADALALRLALDLEAALPVAAPSPPAAHVGEEAPAATGNSGTTW